MSSFDRYLVGFAGRAESAEQLARRERTERSDRLARLRAAEVPLEAGMPARVASAEVSSELEERALERTRMLDRAMALVHVAQASESHARLIVFQGALGRGKTTALGLIVSQLGGIYMTMPDVHELWASKLVTDRAERRKFLRARVLALDEVGFEPDDETSRKAMHEIIDRRQELITVLGTNLANDGRNSLRGRYNPRTVDRIGLGDVVTSEGRTFRLRRPWRRVLDLPERGAITHEQVDAAARVTRELYLAKGFSPIESDGEGIELFVELNDCHHAALAELGPRPKRTAEAA